MVTLCVWNIHRLLLLLLIKIDFAVEFNLLEIKLNIQKSRASKHTHSVEQFYFIPSYENIMRFPFDKTSLICYSIAREIHKLYMAMK